MPISKKRSYLLNILFSFAIFLVVMQLAGRRIISEELLILICINCIMAVSLNLATGLLGELCLGHAGFMAVGAYTSALFVMRSGVPTAIAFPISLALGGILTAFSAFLIGIPALRLRGDYLAIITLAFGEIISILLRSFKFTGGAKGLSGIKLISTLPWAYWTLIVVMYVVYALIRSRHGRAIVAIREDDIAADAAGINTTRYKMLAFVTSAFFAGIAGGLFAHLQGILAPEKFNFNYSIDFMVMVVFGGMGSITGSILSAGILTLLPVLLLDFNAYRLLIYAVLLIILMIFKPEGLLGQKEISQRFFANIARRINRSASKRSGTVGPTAEEKDPETADYLTEQGPAKAGVGGGRVSPQENLPVEGTPVAEADIKTQTSLGLDASGEEPVVLKKKGRR